MIGGVDSAHPDIDGTELARRFGETQAGVALNPTTSPDSIEWVLPYLDYVLIMSVNPGFGGQPFISEMVEKVNHRFPLESVNEALEKAASGEGIKVVIMP